MGDYEMKSFLGVEKQTLKEAWRMAWPAIVESFFVAFAGLVDSLMVSSLGAYAVAAVGLTAQPKFIGLAVFLAMNVSISALVARRRGEGRKREANQLLYTALVFIVIASLVLGGLFVALADPLMHWCGSEPATHDSAVLYFRIIMGGMFFNCVQMGINSAQRGAGNTRITMVTNVTSNTVNIIFNYLLINGHFGFPAWGIKGAAIATVLGTVVSSVMSVMSILKKDGFVSIPYILREKIRPAWQSLKQMILIGYGVFLEQILMRVGFLMTALMAARQGTDAMAAHQVGMNIMSLSFSFGDGLQAASVALIGRSLGQGNKELAKAYATTCRRMGTVISVTLAILYYVGAELLMRLFFTEEHIIAIGVGVMHVILFVVLFQIHQVIYMGCLRGAGDTTYTAIASAISVTVVRTGISYLGGYVLGLGIVGIWLGILADQMARYAFSSVRFRQGKWVDIHI